MGCLDLLSQANIHIKTVKPTYSWVSQTAKATSQITVGFLGLTQPSQHKDALPSKIQVLGCKEMFDNHKQKWNIGKKTLGAQI